MFSGFEHQGHCNEQPFKKTVVRMPGPSCREKRCIFVSNIAISLIRLLQDALPEVPFQSSGLYNFPEVH